jgi:hypothetical protein
LPVSFLWTHLWFNPRLNFSIISTKKSKKEGSHHLTNQPTPICIQSIHSLFISHFRITLYHIKVIVMRLYSISDLKKIKLLSCWVFYQNNIFFYIKNIGVNSIMLDQFNWIANQFTKPTKFNQVNAFLI